MNYTVLARKYRPQTFDELVGQEHVARTIGNAIASNRVAHAFLFTGARGVGKTTTARLLAKSLNCESGPTASPCNMCGPCIDITQGRDMDVQEIDGASNNSVDDVRRLQETLPFRPVRDRHKVVIVDEVHMLSTGAFNAFLKTLEEPPSHVKFIFATTESHKVPVTIRSRCQRYDFRLISRAIISTRVRQILLQENINADDDAIALVAREAAGSMRDALTLLDQMIAFAGANLIGKEIAGMLGIATRGNIQSILSSILTGDPKTVLISISELIQGGVDSLHLTRQLVHELRDLSVFQISQNDKQLVDWVDEDVLWANHLLKNISAVDLQRVFSMTTKLVDDIARAPFPFTMLEMGLLRIASRPQLQSIESLLARLDQFDSGIKNQNNGNSSNHTLEPNFKKSQPSLTQASASGAMASSAPSLKTKEKESQPKEQNTTLVKKVDHMDDEIKRPALLTWTSIIHALRTSQPALSAMLEHGIPRMATREKIILSFQRESFYGKQANQPEAKDAILSAAFKILGHKPELEIRFDADETQSVNTVASIEAQRRQSDIEMQQREVLQHQGVLDILDVFPEAKSHIDIRFHNDETRDNP